MPRTQTQESNISNNKRSYARISLKVHYTSYHRGEKCWSIWSL